jgi:hypothetical protein
MDTLKREHPETGNRRTWEPPSLKTLGTIGEVVQMGGGKLSTVGGDPGESRKQQSE